MNTYNDVRKILNSFYSDLQNQQVWYNSRIVRQEPHGGFTTIDFKSPPFGIDSLSEASKQMYLEFMKTDIAKKVSHVFNNLHNDLLPALIQECLDVFLNVVLTMNHQLTASFLDDSAKRISNWLEIEPKKSECIIRLLTELPKKDILHWKYYEILTHERSLMAHRSGITADEFLHRLFHTTTFKFELESNENYSQLMGKIEKFVTSLSYAMWRPIQIDEIQVKNVEWSNCPFLPMFFVRRHGSYKSHTVEAGTVDFFSRSHDNNFVGFGQAINTEKFEKYHKLIEARPELMFPMKKLMRGLFEILSSISHAEHIKFSQSLDGIHDVLIGMDGFIGETPEGIGHRTYFSKMWRGILDSLDFEKRPKANSNKKIVEAMYDLRCALAHGDFTQVENLSSRLKSVLGDFINPGKTDPTSVGIEIADFLKLAFDAITKTDPELKKYDEIKNSLRQKAKENFEKYKSTEAQE